MARRRLEVSELQTAVFFCTVIFWAQKVIGYRIRASQTSSDSDIRLLKPPCRVDGGNSMGSTGYGVCDEHLLPDSLL